MNLTGDQIKDFKRIYQRVLGVELTETEAAEKAKQLIGLIKILFSTNK